MKKIKLVIMVFFIFSFASIAAEPPKQKPLLEIKIKGASKALSENITAHLGSLPITPKERRNFIFSADEKINDAFESMGYYHGTFTKDLNKDSSPWILTLKIKAGHVTKITAIDIKVEGEIAKDSSYLRWKRKPTLAVGDPFNHGVYEDIKSQLITIALTRGYFDNKIKFSQVEVDKKLNTAKVKIEFDSGHRYKFGEVLFTGGKVNLDLLQPLVPFSKGDYYKTSLLTKLTQNLAATNYYANTKVIPTMNEIKEGEVPVKVELASKPRHTFEVGVGADLASNSDSSGSSIEPRFIFNWKTPVINSKGHSQVTTFEWSRNKPKLLTTYTIPLTDLLNDKLQFKGGIIFDTYGMRQQVNNDGSYTKLDDLESKKYELGVSRKIKLTNGWFYSYGVDAIEEIYTQDNIEYKSPFILGQLSLFKIDKSYGLDPKDAFRQSYSLDYGDPILGSNTRILRLQANFKKIKTYYDKHRFVTRADFGYNYIKNDELDRVGPSLRYFAGGDQSIRGFNYQELGPVRNYVNSSGQNIREVVGGRYLAVVSGEYQYYVTPTWRAATFIDAGNAFDNTQFKPIVSVGVGVHWISPVGPIKLDLGVGVHGVDYYKSTPWRLHLTMGTEI